MNLRGDSQQVEVPVKEVRGEGERGGERGGERRGREEGEGGEREGEDGGGRTYA